TEAALLFNFGHKKSSPLMSRKIFFFKYEMLGLTASKAVKEEEGIGHDQHSHHHYCIVHKPILLCSADHYSCSRKHCYSSQQNHPYYLFHICSCSHFYE